MGQCNSLLHWYPDRYYSSFKTLYSILEATNKTLAQSVPLKSSLLLPVLLCPHVLEKGKCVVVVRGCLVAVMVLVVYGSFVQSMNHGTHHKGTPLSLLFIELGDFTAGVYTTGVFQSNIGWRDLEEWSLARHEILANFVLGHEPLSDSIALTVVDDMWLQICTWG